MKKLFLCFVAMMVCLLVFSCKEELAIDISAECINESKLACAIDFDVSPDEAVNAAYNYFGKKMTKSSVEDAMPIEYNGQDVAYYVNMQEGGWVIVSGDKRMQTILAYNPEGLFCPDSLEYGPMLWLESLSKDIYSLKMSSDVMTDSPYLNRWGKNKSLRYAATKGDGGDDHTGEWLQDVYVARDFVSICDVNHLTRSIWHQNEPYNTFMPTKRWDTDTLYSAGCATVAIAQMMKHLHSNKNFSLEEPSFGSFVRDGFLDLGISYEDTTGIFCNWEGITGFCITPEERLAVAHYFAGILNDIKQHYSGWLSFLDFFVPFSSVHESQIVNYFARQGVGCTGFVDFDPDLVVQSLNNGYPVIIAANSSNSVFNPGHMWLIDGARAVEQYDVYYRKWMPIGTYPPVEPEEPDWDNLEDYVVSDRIYGGTDYLFLMNWGWGRNDNTYYYLGNNWYAPSSGHENFIYHRRILHGFSQINY